MNEEDMDELVFLWGEYVKKPNSKLTRDAIKLKQQVVSYVASLPKFVEEEVKQEK
jgi:hypothetical protein